MISNLASFLDLANHHANATPNDIQGLCAAVAKFGFNAAFLNPYYIPLAKKLLGPQAKVGTVIAFPLGQDTLTVKLAAAQDAANLGADELDISLNLGLLKQALWDDSLNEMNQLVSTVKTSNQQKIVKFILETGYLTPNEIKKGSQLILASGADFVKTCSGFGPRGTTLEDVKLIKQAIGNKIPIKVAGGIATYDQVVAFINAGASRIGTSKAVAIISAAPTS